VLSWILDHLISWPEQLARGGMLVSGYRHRRIATSSGTISLLEAVGEGKVPLLMLHGFASEGVHYAPLLRLLRPHASRVYVPDLPAHGRSAPPSAPIHTGELREEITEAFDKLLTEPAVIFGNSLGGLIALDYALSRPEKVRGLIVCSPAGAAMSAEDLQHIRAQFDLKSYAEALAFVDRLFVRRHALRPLVAWGVRRKFARPNLRTLLDALRPGDFLSADELATLRVPTLLLWGKKDHILPRTSLALLKAQLPPSTIIEENDEDSHTPYLEDPRAMADRIVRFMRSVGG
jgi:pimeloyl-ACP methyl ester carboxylesterase